MAAEWLRSHPENEIGMRDVVADGYDRVRDGDGFVALVRRKGALNT